MINYDFLKSAKIIKISVISGSDNNQATIMNNFLNNLPFEYPVEIICILFLVFWFVPLISRKAKVPSIILLIISGIIIGPFGLNIINNDNSIKLLADIGIMFIMFLAGIELDAKQIQANKKNSIIFGGLTFIIPFAIGFGIFYFLLSYPILASILIALMFSTQTLVSYPIASRLGLSNNKSVISAVGGTIVTDTAVLFFIGIIIASHNGLLTSSYLLKFLLLIAGFVALVVFIFPIIIKRFFKRFEDGEYSHFSLLMALLFLAGSIAHFVQLEGIIGAFFAGIILNKYIPKNSALMSNLHFTGNAIFIPIFLIYVGMLIDYKSVINSSETILLSLAITVPAIIAKWLAAWVSGRIFKFNSDEIGLLFGLSVSHAAVVIATALIGYNIGIISIAFLNATVILILLSCIVSSYATESYGKRIVISDKSLAIADDYETSDRVIVPYANPNTVDTLLDIAVATVYPNPNSIIYPLTVVQENDKQYRNTISINKKRIAEIAQKLYSQDVNFNPISRIDMNPVIGINRAVKEMTATVLVVGWTGKMLRKSDTLGKNIEVILANTDCQTMICNTKEPLNLFNEIIVVVPDYAQYEKGFRKWMYSVDTISRNIAANVTFICNELTSETLKHFSSEWKINMNVSYLLKKSYSEVAEHFEKINKNTLVLFVYARDNSISDDKQVDNFVRTLRHYEQKINFIIIVPEQYS